MPINRDYREYRENFIEFYITKKHLRHPRHLREKQPIHAEGIFYFHADDADGADD